MHPPSEFGSYISDPASYDLWWDAQTLSIAPEGSARPGQEVRAQTAALGKRWPVSVRVEMVDDSERRIHLKTVLPLGITAHNHISCVPLDETNCRVSFG
jgi:hypothetical protein